MIRLFLKCHSDKEIMSEICWTISYFLQMRDDRDCRIRKVMSMGVTSMLMTQLDSSELEVLQPTIRIFRYLSYATKDIVDKFCTPFFLKQISSLLYSEFPDVVCDACWTISNLILTSASIYDSLFQNETIKQIINIAVNDMSLSICEEAIQCVFLFISKGDFCHIEMLIDVYSIIDVLTLCLKRNSEKVVLRILDCLDLLIRFGEEFKEENEPNKMALLINKSDHFKNFFNLKGLKNSEINGKVKKLLELYIEPIFLLKK
jgi:hypothetical protein